MFHADSEVTQFGLATATLIRSVEMFAGLISCAAKQYKDNTFRPIESKDSFVSTDSKFIVIQAIRDRLAKQLESNAQRELVRTLVELQPWAESVRANRFLISLFNYCAQICPNVAKVQTDADQTFLSVVDRKYTRCIAVIFHFFHLSRTMSVRADKRPSTTPLKYPGQTKRSKIAPIHNLERAPIRNIERAPIRILERAPKRNLGEKSTRETTTDKRMSRQKGEYTKEQRAIKKQKQEQTQSETPRQHFVFVLNKFYGNDGSSVPQDPSEVTIEEVSSEDYMPPPITLKQPLRAPISELVGPVTPSNLQLAVGPTFGFEDVSREIVFGNHNTAIPLPYHQHTAIPLPYHQHTAIPLPGPPTPATTSTALELLPSVPSISEPSGQLVVVGARELVSVPTAGPSRLRVAFPGALHPTVLAAPFLPRDTGRSRELVRMEEDDDNEDDRSKSIQEYRRAFEWIIYKMGSAYNWHSTSISSVGQVSIQPSIESELIEIKSTKDLKPLDVAGEFEVYLNHLEKLEHQNEEQREQNEGDAKEDMNMTTNGNSDTEMPTVPGDRDSQM